MASIAPGSIKLFGEHAVIYNRVGVSASFDRHAKANISHSGSDNVEVHLNDLGLFRTFTEKELMEQYERLELASSKTPANAGEKDAFLPFAYIIGSAFLRSGFKPMKIEIKSDVPRNSGLGSSSAIFVALANELNSFLKLNLSIDGVIELANKGDMIVHGKPSGIDVNTCARGGFLRFRKGEETVQLKSNVRIKAVIADSLVKKNTGEMIARVAKAYEKDKVGINEIFDEMQEAAFAGIEALESGDLIKLGAEFDRAQLCFNRLGLNTKETDEIIRFAKKNKVYGAKITGAGGGGCVLILTPSPSKLVPLLNKMGYPSFETELGVEGAKHMSIV